MRIGTRALAVNLRAGDDDKRKKAPAKAAEITRARRHKYEKNERTPLF